MYKVNYKEEDKMWLITKKPYTFFYLGYLKVLNYILKLLISNYLFGYSGAGKLWNKYLEG